MKLCSIHIKRFRQFQDTVLDFTNPQTGKPSNKICFIGPNGSGKSTLLEEIKAFLPNLQNYSHRIFSFCLLKIELNGNYFYILSSDQFKRNYFLDAGIEKNQDLLNQIKNIDSTQNIHKLESQLENYSYSNEEYSDIRRLLTFNNNSKDVLIYSPAESAHNKYYGISDVPKITLDQSLGFLGNFPFGHVVSDQTIEQFWKILVYLINNRESKRVEFETREDNIDKSKRQLISEFNKTHPHILLKIEKLWNKILNKAGLYFDSKRADIPTLLKQNLKAYIYLKKTNERINYSNLSTGIRNYIFRLGHIYSLFFNREIEKGFLLLDEPENSLYPDFLFDLVDTYFEVLKDKNGNMNTQLFLSTHNPIIAAQFEPHERLILEWNENGSIKASKGYSPVGDDPNDILFNDFHLKNLMGRAGQKMWDKYILLRKKLKKEKNSIEKKKLLSEINKIGKEYNFE